MESLENAQTILLMVESRSAFYRMLYKLLYCPMTQEDVDAMDPDVVRSLVDQADSQLMAEGYNDMYRFMRRKNTGTRQVLNADFTRGFLGMTTYHGLSAMPYASLYTSPEGRLMGSARNAVRKVYKEHRVKLEEGVDLPEDHLAFECEFLAILNDRTAEAVSNGDRRLALDLLETQRTFLDEQVMNWFDRFYNLAMRIIETRFYHGVLKITKGFLESEPERIAHLANEIRRV